MDLEALGFKSSALKPKIKAMFNCTVLNPLICPQSTSHLIFWKIRQKAKGKFKDKYKGDSHLFYVGANL